MTISTGTETRINGNNKKRPNQDLAQDTGSAQEQRWKQHRKQDTAQNNRKQHRNTTGISARTQHRISNETPGLSTGSAQGNSPTGIQRDHPGHQTGKKTTAKVAKHQERRASICGGLQIRFFIDQVLHQVKLHVFTDFQ